MANEIKNEKKQEENQTKPAQGQENKQDCGKKKSKTFKRIMKWTAYIIAVLALGLLTLPLWISPAVKGVANWKVPDVTGCGFKLEKFDLALARGALDMGGCRLDNPQGGDPEFTAFSVDSLYIDINCSESTSEKIIIDKVWIDGLRASYLSINGTNNFDIIKENVTGEQAKLAAMTEEERKEYLAKKEAEEKAKKEEEERLAKEGGGIQIVIRDFKLTNSKIKIGLAPEISLPDLHLENIGENSHFVTVGDGILQTFKSLLAGCWNQLPAPVRKSIELALEGIGATIGAIVDVGGAAVKAVGEVGGKAVDFAAEAGGKAVDAIGNAGGKAVDAIGDAGGAAVDAVKGIFK